VRTLSSSTFQAPSLVAHEVAAGDVGVDAAGGRMPCAARAKCERLAISVQGTIPALTISRSW
jgi:hypothetical protein